MRATIFLLMAATLLAQSATISPSAPTPPVGGYAPGAVIPITISKTGNLTTALQLDVGSMAGVANITWTIAPGIAATKSVSCAFNGSTTCIVVGPNQAVIPDGPFVTATVTLAPTISIPTVTFTIFPTAIESDKDGNSLPVTVTNPTISLSIRNRCDVDGDGSVGSADLQAVVAQVIARTTTAATDLNSDGKTNVLDAQIVATAASGGPCNSK